MRVGVPWYVYSIRGCPSRLWGSAPVRWMESRLYLTEFETRDSYTVSVSIAPGCLCPSTKKQPRPSTFFSSFPAAVVASFANGRIFVSSASAIARLGTVLDARLCASRKSIPSCSSIGVFTGVDPTRRPRQGVQPRSKRLGVPWAAGSTAYSGMSDEINAASMQRREAAHTVHGVPVWFELLP
jgi:hypothetical protein